MIRIFFVVLSVFINNFLFAQAPKLILPIGHTDNITATHLSSNEKYILTASEDKTAKLWDAASGKLIHTFKEHEGSILTAIFSPDEKTFVTASDDNTTRVWSVKELKLLFTFNTPGVRKIIYEPSGNKIITSSSKGELLLWDVVTGKLITALKGHTNYANLLSFNKKGNLLITGSADKTVKIWNIETFKILFSFTHKGLINEMKLNADEKLLLTVADEENGARLWDVSSGKLYKTLTHESGINAAAFNEAGSLVVTASDDKTAKIWDVSTGSTLYTLESDTMNIEDAVFSKDGSMVATVRLWSRSVQVWETSSGKLLHHLQFDTNTQEEIKKVKFSPDNKTLYTLSLSGKLHLWNLRSGKHLISINEPIGMYGTFGGVDPFFTKDAKKLIGITKAGIPALWNINNGKKIYSLQSSVKKTAAIKWSTNGKKLLTSDDEKVMLWDAVSGKLLLSRQHAKNDNKTFTEWGEGDNSFLVISPDTTVNIWDAASGKLLLKIKEESEIYKAIFSPDKKKILTLASDSVAKIWNAANGKLLHTLKGHNENIFTAAFSANSKKLVTSSWGTSTSVSKMWDVETGKLLFDLGKIFFNQVKFNNTGDAFLTIADPFFSTENNITIWNALTGKVAGILKGHTKMIFGADFSADGKMVISSSDDFTVKVWDVKTFRAKTTFKEHKDAVSIAVFSKDGTKALSGSAENIVMLWNVEDGKVLQTFKGHTDWIENAAFTPDEKAILTTSYDNTNIVWNVETGKPLYKFFAVNNDDFFVQDFAGYYMSSRDASKKLHYINSEKNIITFDQLDIKYNRPDVVLRSLPYTDTSLITSYKKAYHKRIKKLGIDTTLKTGDHIPEADFMNRDVIAAEQDAELVTLNIKGSDRSYPLDKFNVWINDVPVFGMQGVQLNKRSNYLDTTITVSLSQGENIIETSVTTIAGTESYKMPLYIRYVPLQPKKEKLYFIGIGINEFKDGKNKLQWCVKDIRDLTLKLKEQWKDDIIIDTLFNQQVTLENVFALKGRLKQTDINDRVVLAFSGHGLLSKDYDYYLSTYNVNFDKPEENGLSYEALEGLLDGIPSRKKLMLLDACHSGEVDKEEMAKYERSKSGIDSSARSSIKVSDKSKLGMKNSFELMQELFVNVGKSTGATIISAAAGTQFALERANLQNGVFTFSILEYMNNNKNGSISNLKEYVNKRVPELTNGMQVPTTRNEAKAVDWNLW